MAEPGRKKTIEDREILQAIALAPDPIVTQQEMADRLPLTSAGIGKRMNQLVEKGHLEARDVGARAKVYWITKEGREYVAD